jgi:hypothetical protein
MHYDEESNLISLEIAKGKIAYAKDFGNVIIHFSKAKKPILIEILDASKFVGQFDQIKNLKEIKRVLPAGS